MAFVLAFLGFAALIILHEAGHFVAAKAVGMRVERFSLFFPPLIAKFRRGETEYGIGSIPLGGYVKITGMNPEEEIPEEVRPRAYYNQAVWRRIVTILAGPFVNLVIAFGLFVGIILTEGQQVAKTSHGQPVYSRTIESVNAAPAPAAGVLQPGDTIVAVDGRPTTTVPAVTRAIEAHRCAGTPTAGCAAATPARITVQRAGRRLTVALRPRYDASDKAMHIGIAFPPVVVTLSPGLGAAASGSLSYMWYVTKTTVSHFVHIFVPKDRHQLHSVVGAYRATANDFNHSATDGLTVLGLISLSLAVINLFPFLPLDGGHVFWALAEKVRRRRISFAVMERAGLVGFALIAVIFVIGLTNDISALSGPAGPH